MVSWFVRLRFFTRLKRLEMGILSTEKRWLVRKMLTIFQYVRLQIVTNSNALEMRILSTEKPLLVRKMLTIFSTTSLLVGLLGYDFSLGLNPWK